MTRLAQIRPDLTRAIGLLLMVPFVVLSLIAPGTMAVRDAHGTLRMVICAADGGMVEMVLDATTGEPVQTPPDDGRCDWAQMAMADPRAPAPLPPPPLHLPVLLSPASPDDLWQPAHDPRGLYARGPPTLT